jgi:hypothetical protein
MVRYWWHSLEEDTIEIIPHGNTCSIMEELVSNWSLIFLVIANRQLQTHHIGWMVIGLGYFFSGGFPQPNPTQPNPTTPS